MKHSATITAVLFAIVLVACGGNRALPAEQVMLPNPDREELWLMDVQSKDATGRLQNDCAMITYVPQENDALTTAFIAHLDTRDSIYRYGIRVSNGAQWTGKDRWPMVAEISADSAGPAFRWSLGRKFMWLDGSLTVPDLQPLKLHGQMDGAHAFAMHQISRSPDVILMHPMAFHPDAAQATQAEDAELNLVNFKNVSLLMDPAENYAAIFWMHIRPKGGEQDYFLLKMRTDGELVVLAHYNESTASSFPGNFRAAVHASSNWLDPARRKNYPLGIDIAAGRDTLRIRPLIPNQAIQAGKRSFWMGAVRTADAQGHDEGVCGNMWVLLR